MKVNITEVAELSKIIKVKGNWIARLFFHKDCHCSQGTLYVHIFVTSYGIKQPLESVLQKL